MAGNTCAFLAGGTRFESSSSVKNNARRTPKTSTVALALSLGAGGCGDVSGDTTADAATSESETATADSEPAGPCTDGEPTHEDWPLPAPGDVGELGCGSASWVRIDPTVLRYFQVIRLPDGGTVLTGEGIVDDPNERQGVIVRRGPDASVLSAEFGNAKHGSSRKVHGPGPGGCYYISGADWVDENCVPGPYDSETCSRLRGRAR